MINSGLYIWGSSPDKYSMRYILITLTIFLISASYVGASDYQILQNLGCAFDVPEGWSLDSTEADRITALYDQSHTALISVKRYMIDRANQIESDADLAEAISGLYGELGIGSAADDQDNFYIQGDRAIFETEYDIDEESQERKYKNFLKGIIIRLPNGRQVLYLMMAVAAEKIYEKVESDLTQALSSFEVTANTSENLYSRRDITPYLLIFLIFMLTAFFFARNRRVQKSRNPFGRNSNFFWRCSSCRLVNHIDHLFCTRCGRKRTEPDRILR